MAVGFLIVILKTVVGGSANGAAGGAPEAHGEGDIRAMRCVAGRPRFGRDVAWAAAGRRGGWMHACMHANQYARSARVMCQKLFFIEERGGSARPVAVACEDGMADEAWPAQQHS